MPADETATMVCNMVYKVVAGLKAGKKGYYSINNVTKDESVNSEKNDTIGEKDELKEEKEEVNKEKDYCSVVKKVKKDNITIDNIGEIMLCQIPGISSVTAIAILSKFKNLPDLILEMKKDPTCLNTISYTTSNGQSRKISKACIASIIKFLIV